MYVPTLQSLSDGLIFTVQPTPTRGYDRTPPRNIADFPKCATQAVHDAAHRNCQPTVISTMLRGLGLLNLSTANPCWVETLPICRTPPPLTPVAPPPPVLRTPPPLTPVAPPPPVVRAPPRLTAVAPPPPVVRAPPPLTPVAPPPPVVRAPPLLTAPPAPSAPAATRPPPILSAPPVVAVSPPPVMSPPAVVAVEAQPQAQAGFSTAGLLAIAAGVAIGGWLLFKPKKQAA